MKNAILIAIAIPWLLLTVQTGYAGGEKGSLGVGLRVGLTQLEADIPKPQLSPLFYGHVKFNPIDFLSLGCEFGYATLKDKERTTEKFQTSIMPFEADLTFNFLPLSKVNPYVQIGGGGVYWNATTVDKSGVRKTIQKDGKLQEGVDSFVKTGGGLEFVLNRDRNLTLSVGGTFRYSLSDALDQIYSGDENDQVIDFYGGLTYYFKTSTRGDRDSDGVPDELDLDNMRIEDPDGYCDHDGKPEPGPDERFSEVMDASADTANQGTDTNPPIVIHNPVRKAEEGADVTIDVEVWEDREIRIVSILYRTLGDENWRVRSMRTFSGRKYTGVIPGSYVKPPGVEYCCVAVDEAVSGVGYSGLPKRPNIIKVIPNPKQWRVMAATAAVLGWGSAAYLIMRKQKE
ncbi:hypothetical protein JXJ21_23620 [candidate division KSB1 bacterium]|nr:hypothetical protein [candidate division KSB1 bacterium]